MTTSRPRTPRGNDNHMPVLIKSSVTNIGSVLISYVYGICCQHPVFVRKTARQKYCLHTFPYENKCSKGGSQMNADLDFIRRIHPECGFQGFTIRFWICSKTRKILSEFGNPDWDFPRTTHP